MTTEVAKLDTLLATLGNVFATTTTSQSVVLLTRGEWRVRGLALMLTRCSGPMLHASLRRRASIIAAQDHQTVSQLTSSTRYLQQ